jgi:hypothetical protein
LLLDHPKFVFVIIKVRFHFFFYNGQGNILDEQDDEAMDFEKEVDPYNVDTLLTLSEYCTFQNRFPAEANEKLDTKMEEIAEEIATEALDGRKYNIYSDKEKAIFYALGYQKTTTTTMDFRPFFFRRRIFF